MSIAASTEETSFRHYDYNTDRRWPDLWVPDHRGLHHPDRLQGGVAGNQCRRRQVRQLSRRRQQQRFPRHLRRRTARRWFRSVFYSLIYDTLDSHADPRDGFYTSSRRSSPASAATCGWLRTTGCASYYHELLADRDVIGLQGAGRRHLWAGRGRPAARRLLQRRRDRTRLRNLGRSARATSAPTMRLAAISTSPERLRCSSPCRCSARDRAEGRRSSPMRAHCSTPIAAVWPDRKAGGRCHDPLLGRRFGPLGLAARAASCRLRLGDHQRKLRRDAVVPLQRRHPLLILLRRPRDCGRLCRFPDMRDTRFFPAPALSAP